ncbi:hypothetical protein CBF23_011400 [Marinomonas agarivorans]|nr:hypothetical protein CBF23_011400 [Marinomonas agarivorans]
MANGQQIAKENLSKFEQWVSERNLVGDIEMYVRGKQLNRSEIASKCGFALSVLRQNPAVKNALVEFEDGLRKKGILPKQGASKATATKTRKTTTGGNQRLRDLEEKNEALKARVKELEHNQTKESLFELHLFETGRAIKP